MPGCGARGRLQGTLKAAPFFYQGYVHTDIVSILLDHQGEKPDLDGTTDLEEPGAGRSLPLQEGQEGGCCDSHSPILMGTSRLAEKMCLRRRRA